MGPQGEQQPYNIGQEEHDSCKPNVRLDGFFIESIVDSRGLRIVAPPTVSLIGRPVIANTLMTVQLVLQSRLALHCSSGRRTYASINLVEQGGPECANDGKEEHGRSNTRRLDVEALSLPFEGTEAH